MHTHANPFPPGIETRIETLRSYTWLNETEAQVFYPTDATQLQQLFRYAKDNDCRVTLRGGAHAFDEQSLGKDLVVSMTRFNDIQVKVFPQGNQVTVGPGARWGEILLALEGEGLMARTTVTGSDASAGGTLAGDCLSRFSPAYGKEGERVASFDLVAVDSDVGDPPVTYTRPDPLKDPSNWTDDERAFAGVIGGLGYLGAVTSITYDVLKVDDAPPIQVETRVQKHEGFEDCVDQLVDTSEQMNAEQSSPNDPKKVDSVFSALHAGRLGGRSALVFTSRITTGRKLKRMQIHKPRAWWRVPGEWLMRSSIGEWAFWRLNYWVFTRENTSYVDPLWDYAFLMDGNARAHRVARRWLGRKMQSIQQTFVIPGLPPDKGGKEKTKANLVKWLEDTHDDMRKQGLSPTMLDVMYLPKDRHFPLSATADRAGYAVSYEFETSNPRKLARIKKLYSEWSDKLLDDYNGRVYLVKNVYADRRTLYRMYGANADEFFQIKNNLDPHCILRNHFLERTFGDRLDCVQLTTPPPVVSLPTAVPAGADEGG